MITTAKIYKSYNTKTVLAGVDLMCQEGKIQVLMGANGAGKTTLIHILSGLIEQDSGKCFIDNKEITIDNYKYRSKVGYIFETAMYIQKFSAREYLEFLGKMYKLPKSELLERIRELLEFFELPFDNKLLIESYSKGMKSRVSLAAALIHDPNYLILDEPFDGIDFLLVQKIGKLFKSMARRGVTILIASHQFDVISQMCDRFALLKDGKILFNVEFQKMKEMSVEYNGDMYPVKRYIGKLMREDNSKEELNYLSKK